MWPFMNVWMNVSESSQKDHVMISVALVCFDKGLKALFAICQCAFVPQLNTQSGILYTFNA